MPEAPPSPLSIVLESKKPIIFSGVAGGVVLADAGRTAFATAAEGAEITSVPMPQGLPGEGNVLQFAGRIPSSIWAIFEEPKVGKDPAKNPFLRFERAKGSWKQYADDWKPHLTAWSKNRILALSTSSGKLKIKVVEPHLDKPTPDMPSPRLDDEGCAKSLKIDAISALPSGEVFAAGFCKPADGGRKAVLVRWAESNIAPSPTPLPVEDAGPNDAGASDAGPDGEPLGITGQVIFVPEWIKPAALVAQAPGDVWLLGESEKKEGKIFRLESGKIVNQPLPKLDAPVRALAAASDGTLWLVSERAIWKRYPPGEWEEVPPPTRAFPEPEPHWEMQNVWASGSDIWIAAKHSSSKAERHVVMRLRAAKEILHWP